MVEDTGSVIGKGFDTWKNNLTICLPFVFSAVLTHIVAIIIIGATILAIIPSLLSYITKSAEPSPELILQLLPQIIQSMGIIIIAIIVTIILCMLINAFFWAGAIGMAKEATETGRTDISYMMVYGKRKFISLFFTDIILGLISFVGIIFLVPGILYTLPKLMGLSELPPEEVFTAFAIFGLGFLAMSLYILIISIIFALPRYSVVIGDLGAIGGIKTGFKMFMRNKVAVFLLWLIVFVANMISMSFGFIEYIGWVISAILSIIIISPLTVIWWSRLYLSMTEPTEPTEEL
uniref:DUF7847 domain-containing protein n=1 Tax=Candidatus Methanophagaceae archaeon ANME-1 ERB6 TaxID=2759912 RepID=A0A7G9YY68_9EURY|nr:hypothetical protein IEHOEKMD_00023 [Methanosarcinales archaeon ANME-1 ERB6]QNO53953.1 hypothetical protein MMBEDHBC_00008 [Methanosarcinales archaeon ANME-1 ERB6]